MKFTKYIMLLAAAAGITAACQKLEMVQVVDPSQVVAPVLEQIDPIVVTPETLDEAVNFKWTAADYGAPTQVDYAVEMGLAEGEKIELKKGLHALELSMTQEVINERLLYGLKLEANKEAEVNFYVSSRIGNTEKVYSAPVAVSVKPSQAERVYPMVYVIGNFNGWADGTTQELFDFAGEDAEYSGMIGFGGKAANGFKIRGSEAGWVNELGNWGLNGDEPTPEKEAAKIPLYNDGGSSDIKIYEKNFYNFTLVKATPELKVNFSFNSVGVIGDAVGGWGEDKDMNFSTTKQLFWLDAELVEGPLKFRADDDWPLNWGLEAENADPITSGVLGGDKNIKVPAGQYRIYLDLRNPEAPSFSLSKADYGTANPDPDVPVEPEPEVPEAVEAWSLIGSITEWKSDIIMTDLNGLWLAKDVEFAEGADFKVRWKQSWDEPNPNYGMVEGAEMIKVGEETKLAKGGANIKLDKAGKFNVSFNPETEMIKVYVEGTEPEPVVSEWGIVGTINDWGKTPDRVLVQEGDYFVHKGLVLTDADQVKFRKNNDWGGDVTADPSVCKPNVTILLAAGPGNMKFAAGTYDVYINADCSQCWFMTDGKTPADAEGPVEPEPEPEPVAQAWGLVGDPTGWADGKDIALTEENGIWTLAEIDLTAKQGFKFRSNGSWDVQLGGANETPIESGVEVTLDPAGGSKNLKVKLGGKYKITLNPESKTVKMDLIGDPITPEPEPVAQIWGLVGDPTSWADGKDIALTEKDGIWTLAEIDLTAAQGFKFRVNGAWDVQLGGADETPIESGVEVTLSPDGGSKNLKVKLGGKYKITLNPESKTVKMDLIGDPIAPEPATHTWSIIGAPDFNTDVDMVEKDGIWSATAVRIKANAGFKVRADKKWDLSYGVTGETETVVIALDQELKVTSANGKNLAVATDGLYDITFDPAKETITVKMTPIN